MGTTKKKILVLQLARLGDIFQTWPVLNAIKRANPDCELHFMTRAAFTSAANTMAAYSNAVDRSWVLATKEIISPLVAEKPDIDGSLNELSNFVSELQNEKFDRIVNLSFSGFSAGLTALIANESTDKVVEVRGYSRFEDRSLNLIDDESAYFYAQVGPDRGNRIHVTDLFAAVAGVSLEASDWEISSTNASSSGRGGIVVHLGASDLAKTLGSSKWLQVVGGLLSKTQESVTLVGSKEEMEIAARVAEVSGERKPLNLVGQTQIPELFEIIRNASLVIGGDSAPVQMASLTNTPVLNLSFPIVSCWETGPRASGSRILRMESEDSFTAEEIVREASSMLAGRASHLQVLKVADRMAPYIETREEPKGFEWNLIKALYMGDSFPEPKSEMFYLAIQRLQEVNFLALEQIAMLKKDPTNQTAAQILDRADELTEQIVSLSPEVGAIVRWFRVERIRIGPMAVDKLVDATRSVHTRFNQVLNIYSATGESHDHVSLD